MAMSNCFLVWVSEIGSEKYLREVSGKVVARLRSLVTAKSFASMVAYTRSMQRVRLLLLRWATRLVASACAAWSGWAVKELEERAVHMAAFEIAKSQIEAMRSQANEELRVAAENAAAVERVLEETEGLLLRRRRLLRRTRRCLQARWRLCGLSIQSMRPQQRRSLRLSWRSANRPSRTSSG